jgi:hypothetical protein
VPPKPIIVKQTNETEDIIAVPKSALVALARFVAPFVASELESRTSAAPTTYGSRAPYPPPPGRSHRWMRDHSKELSAFGAVRTGGKRGRSVIWTIAAENWKRYVESTRRTEPAPTAAPVIDVQRWLQESGHRLTRRAG